MEDVCVCGGGGGGGGRPKRWSWQPSCITEDKTNAYF